jgi:hypothetical protein
VVAAVGTVYGLVHQRRGERPLLTVEAVLDRSSGEVAVVVRSDARAAEGYRMHSVWLLRESDMAGAGQPPLGCVISDRYLYPGGCIEAARLPADHLAPGKVVAYVHVPLATTTLILHSPPVQVD